MFVIFSTKFKRCYVGFGTFQSNIENDIYFEQYVCKFEKNISYKDGILFFNITQNTGIQIQKIMQRVLIVLFVFSQLPFIQFVLKIIYKLAKELCGL